MLRNIAAGAEGAVIDARFSEGEASEGERALARDAARHACAWWGVVGRGRLALLDGGGEA